MEYTVWISGEDKRYSYTADTPRDAFKLFAEVLGSSAAGKVFVQDKSGNHYETFSLNAPSAASGCRGLSTDRADGEEWYAVLTASNGDPKKYSRGDVATVLRRDLLDKMYDSGTKVCIHALGADGKWAEQESALSELITANFPLRVLFQPVWSHALEGIRWGIMVGVGIKLVDNLVICAMINPILALSYLIAVGVCIPKIGKYAIAAGLYLVFMQGMPWPPFMMILSGALVGAVLGALPGMFVGGIVGVVRRGSIPRGEGVLAEPSGIVAKAILLPFMGGCALFAFWIFVVNPWILNWLDTME